MALSDKQKLMRKIQAQSFVLVDVSLYLDSHPNCKNALDFYHKHKAIKEKLIKEYERNYGPFTAMGVEDTDKWTWSTTAFPWERGES